jgi:hypothetical protein
MLKYLQKIKLSSETASDGKECIDMVFSKEPGYYSLIIVWKNVLLESQTEAANSIYSAIFKCP